MTYKGWYAIEKKPISLSEILFLNGLELICLLTIILM